MTPKDQEVESQLKEIRRMVNICSHKGIDRESLTHDIWMELDLLKIPLTFTFVRHRCLHEMRRERVRYTHGDDYLEDVKGKEEENPHNAEEIIGYLMDNSELSSQETNIIYSMFYEKKTKQDIAQSLGMSIDKFNLIYEYILVKLRFTFYKDRPDEPTES